MKVTDDGILLTGVEFGKFLSVAQNLIPEGVTDQEDDNVRRFDAMLSEILEYGTGPDVHRPPEGKHGEIASLCLFSVSGDPALGRNIQSVIEGN